jgi:hypothetical protein
MDGKQGRPSKYTPEIRAGIAAFSIICISSIW